MACSISHLKIYVYEKKPEKDFKSLAYLSYKLREASDNWQSVALDSDNYRRCIEAFYFWDLRVERRRNEIREGRRKQEILWNQIATKIFNQIITKI